MRLAENIGTCAEPEVSSVSGDMTGARASNEMIPISAHDNFKEKVVEKQARWRSIEVQKLKDNRCENKLSGADGEGTLGRESSQTKSIITDLWMSLRQNVDLIAANINHLTVRLAHGTTTR